MDITIISIAILILSVIIHEVCHGYMADLLGDHTARREGRLTLNPLKHIDPIGSILVPIITSIGGFTFGWAKPVPYNPYNLKHRRSGEFLVAAAGPLSNLAIAFVFGTIIRFTVGMGVPDAFIEVCSYIVLTNILLAVFNLIPLPPLDGSKLLFSFLPNQYGTLRQTIESFAPVGIIIVVLFLWHLVAPVVSPVFRIFTGISL